MGAVLRVGRSMTTSSRQVDRATFTILPPRRNVRKTGGFPQDAGFMPRCLRRAYTPAVSCLHAHGGRPPRSTSKEGDDVSTYSPQIGSGWVSLGGTRCRWGCRIRLQHAYAAY